MKKFVSLSVICAMGFSLMTGCSALPASEAEESTVTELEAARPQDDYYRYINQDTLADMEFEYGSDTSMPAFNVSLIDDQIEELIRDVAAGDGYVPGSEEDIIKRAYDLYMDYDFENEDIPEDLADIIVQIDSVTTVDELLDIDAMLVRDYGVNSLLNINPNVNPFVPGEMVLWISQINSILYVPFTGIRDGDDTIDEIAGSGQVVILTCGYDADTSAQYGEDIALLALDIYSGTDMEIIEDSTGVSHQTLMSASEIEEAYSNIDLMGYLSNIGYDTSIIDSFCTCDMGQIEAMNEALTDENIDALKVWELGRFYANYAQYIAPHYPELGAYISTDYSSKDDQAVAEISGVFSAETDPLYVERYYDEDTDIELRSMCDDIKEGYRALISGAEWLSEDTRAELLRKLDNIVYVTGTDIERHDPEEYSDIVGDNYYELCLNYTRHEQSEMTAYLGQTFSRTEAFMNMQDMNACYQPSFNNITITVAITNEPFFDIDADYYTNLGALGMILAHEMGHAFDSDNILYDADGVYDPSWLPDADMDALNERNAQAVEYFENNFTVFGVYHVDGEQTLGENYADLGALECITSLTETDEDRMLLFASFATIWCEKATDDMIIYQIAYDSHSPAVIRVNSILSTIDAFYETYDVTEGDDMYIAPENRISRWY